MFAADAEDLLRQLTPQVLGALVRRYGNFDLAEDATQEALWAAVQQWPDQGLPDNPKGWLIAVAARRLTDLLRTDQARRRREGTVAQWALTNTGPPPVAERIPADREDGLVLLFMSCHPSLSASAQIVLTLRAVGGLKAREIARALLTSESTVTRRITRAKKSIKDSGVPFAVPTPDQLPARLDAVLRVVYLVFTEGYTATSGTDLMRLDLAEEAIRLGRLLHQALPDNGEVSGLLALMILVHARQRARTGSDGSLIPIVEQDRSLWDRTAIDEAIALITAVLPVGETGPYQLQAAIAAVHDEADTAEATDWAQIVALYGVLLHLDDNPVVVLNHAVAVAMATGPEAGLGLLNRLESDPRMNQDRRFYAVRAHLMERIGDRQAALDAYREAARRTTNLQQRRYLHRQIAHLQDRP